MQADLIKDYWEVSPPFKGEGKTGSLEWSRSISEHRFKVVPYLKKFIDAKSYKGKRVLEIGYGSGSDLLEYCRAGADVTGLDITSKAIGICSDRLHAENLKADLINYDGRRLIQGRLEPKSFDLVYSCGVLHHTPFMADILADAHRLLVPEGRLKLMLYHRNSVLYHYILYRRSLEKRVDYPRDSMLSLYSEYREGCPYTRVFSEREIEDLLWYYSYVRTGVEYPVYDTGPDRKIPLGKKMNCKPTGIADIDLFFEKYNNAVDIDADLTRYGWHLLVDASK